MTGPERVVVAADLGAESGRVVLGRFDGARVRLREVHRFPNGARRRDGLLRWDLDYLWTQVHRANMSKLGPDGRPIVRDGKVVKGSGFVPPDVADVLGL